MAVEGAQESEAATAVRGLAWGRWTEEVRLAMAWNGGVSLAVWMGGVAVELDSARRSREELLARRANDASLEKTGDPEQTPAGARTTDELYDAISTAFDRLLVVDIISGASAGGLNGALLAGAMVHDRELTPEFLRERWLDIGDFGKLLQPIEGASPQSVMQGDLFLSRVTEAFEDLLGTTGSPSWSGDEPPPMLDVQATNVVGKQLSFVDDWNGSFYAQEFRAPIRFREPGDYTASSLATAARASASFPVAFEPQVIEGEVARLAGLTGLRRWAIDGGLLENAPIRPAIDLIPYRPASAPVKRYVCYVNAAPTEQATPVASVEQPDITKVISYTINLPRDGRVVDQLTALDDSSRRAGTTSDTGVKLIALPVQTLLATAETLLGTYQQRRAVLGLGLMMRGADGPTGPGPARAVLAQLGKDAGAGSATAVAAGALRLPFIPVDFTPAREADGWRWGVRTAQRIVQLELDLLRAVLLVTTDESDAEAIFGSRTVLDHALFQLNKMHADYIGAGGVLDAVAGLRRPQQSSRTQALADLTVLTEGYAASALELLDQADATFAQAYRSLTPAAVAAAGLPTADILLGGVAGPPGDGFRQSALAIEVIRRSFTDDFDLDSAATLHVAQLTPLIASPLFDRGTLRFDEPPPADGTPAPASPGALGPKTSKDKLAGLRVNHFGGFYRSSWRANDFMWGRLDGAAAIARVLVDPERADVLKRLGRDEALEPAQQLARALVPSGDPQPGDDDRCKLIWELIGPGATAPLPQPDDLRTQLAKVLAADLANADGHGELTWAICTRALQYQVLREEMSHLVDQAAKDRDVGAFCTELDWALTDSGSLKGPIDYLRNGRGANALPARLGCDQAEEGTSTLALRTISQAFLVLLSAIGGAVPLTRSLAPVRMPLLAVQGVTARRFADRLCVLLGFTGAAWYLSARWATVPPDQGDIPLKAVWNPATLALWVCILGVIGLVAVPALRGLRAKRPDGTRDWTRTGVNGGIALLLLLAAGIVGFVFQWFDQGIVEALTTWNSSYEPPDWLLWVVVAIGGFHVASILTPVLHLTQFILKALGGYVAYSALIVGVVGGLLAGWSLVDGLVRALDDGGMVTLICVLAFPAPVIAFFQLGLWSPLKRKLGGSGGGGGAAPKV